ncbi:MAG: hypothetical protein AAF404_03695 [Pseudomonadota bacterium]
MKKYGIKIVMPGGDTMAADHLLGEGWAAHRWYDTEQQRDQALSEMQQQPPYYRKGDSPTVVLEKVEQE